MAEGLEAKRERAAEIYKTLKKAYPDARCTLDFETPYQLLMATILAAQCTDERVNMVTPALFKKYGDAKRAAKADAAELQEMIKSTGFFRNKAKSIIATSKKLVEESGGDVPEDMDALTSLPGVGRKTANVIRGAAFGRPAIIVDTHCKRVTARLGLTKNTDPDKIEQDLSKIVPEGNWTLFSHLMVFHGRNICKAPKPLCPRCPVIKLCPYPDKTRGEATPSLL